MIIETHAHLDMEQFASDLPDVIGRAAAADVAHIITIGTDIASSIKAAGLSDAFEPVYFSAGIHPHDVKDIGNGDYDALVGLLAHKKAVAVGEAGLDYHYDLSPRDTQREQFANQIQVAKGCGKPVIVHSREANLETMDILESEGAVDTGGTLHCFSGDYHMAKRALDMGLYISVGGTLTFKKTEPLQDIIKKAPIERILVETDCPYLAPHPMRGRRNEPSFLVHIVERLAEIKGLSVEDVKRITSLNAATLFGIGVIQKEGAIAYPIRDSLYLNITNRCTNNCAFCARNSTDFVKGHNLRLGIEPDVADILRSMEGFERYKEVVFCGYGEPFLRLDVIKEVAAAVKAKGVRVRVNTNGHALIIHGRDILPEIAGLVDALSVSLNFPTREEYDDACRPLLGEDAYGSLKEFVLKAKEYVPDVTVTVVGVPGVDIEACRKIAEDELGVKLRVREYNEVG